ncbi:MAG: hydroxyacid dehydrogenase [Alphaproteobacteria bacterium]|nr:hydroxyacid dehydrogenase [Alphaproteobacteria bacterium]
MRVLLADKLSPHVTDALEDLGCAVISDPSLSGDSLADALRRHDPAVLVVRSTKVLPGHFEAARNLSLVIRAGAGVNTIALDEASGRGVYVANCPGKNAAAVAELTLGHLINCDRRIADNVASLRAGRWEKKEFGKARGLAGLTLAVLGCGQIGQEVIQRAKAFDMNIRAWSRSLTPKQAAALGVEFAATPLDACRGADALTVHLALTSDTRGLIDRELLEALRPGAYFVNTSRGEVVVQDDLLAAVETRGLRAGLDVFAEEPAGGEGDFPYAIKDVGGVYGTHHIGASTQQATTAVGDEVLRIVASFIDSGHVPNCVNLAERTDATHLLVVRHRDEVGVLAAVLDRLGKDGVNVQEMENIIFKGGGAACARIQLAQAPSAETLAALDAHASVYATSLVALDT